MESAKYGETRLFLFSERHFLSSGLYELVLGHVVQQVIHNLPPRDEDEKFFFNRVVSDKVCMNEA